MNEREYFLSDQPEIDGALFFSFIFRLCVDEFNDLQK